MKAIEKSTRLKNVKYEVRGVLAQRAEQLEAAGEPVLKLNIGNPALFGFSSGEEILSELKESAFAAQDYSGASGLECAREAILK